MRFRVGRLLGVSALYLLFGLQLPGCSGQQEQDEAVEAENQAANEEGGENQAATNEEGGENQAAANEEGGENQAADNGAAEENGGDATAEAGNGATENDLQEIIQEMNSQPAADAGAANAGAPLQNNTASAQPAAAPPPANNAAAAPPPPAQPAAPAIPFQPGGSPAAPGLPEVGSKLAYVVEHGDTLAKISQKVYGTPGRWQEMATLSGISNPSRIFPGDLVYYTLDESAVAFATAYDSIKRSEEQVKPGDTLATIAQRVYGSTNAWRSIWRQNDHINNPDIIPPGSTVFYVPKGALTAAKKSHTKSVNLARVAKHKNVGKGAVSTAKSGGHVTTFKSIKVGVKLADSHSTVNAFSFVSNIAAISQLQI